jgi:hypothetical protein
MSNKQHDEKYDQGTTFCVCKKVIEGDVCTTFFRRGYQFESCLKK